MKRVFYLIMAIGFIGLSAVGQIDNSDKTEARLSSSQKSEYIKYPETKMVDTINEYFGVKVSDPYRWLEDDNSKETAEWVEAENKVTFSYLDQIPFRDRVKERLEKIWDYPKYGTPFKRGENYFYFKNDGLQNQSVLYIQKGLDGEPEVFLDPNKLSEDGTVALSGMSVSENGEYFAYSVSRSGSDWKEVFFMDVKSKEKLEDHLEWMKFSGLSWKDDGIYYSSYDAPEEGEELSGKNEFHKVYYHKIGSTQKDDILIYENEKFPLRNYYAGTTEDESYLILTETESTSGNSLYVRKADAGDKDFTLIAEGFDNDYHVIDNIDNMLLVYTNDNAPRYRLVLIDPEKPDLENWKELIPEQKDVLQSVSLIGGKIVAEYMHDAASKAYIYDYNGKMIEELSLPGIGSMSGMSGKKDEDMAFYSFTSFTFPSTIFKYDILKNRSQVYRKSEIDFDGDKYETKQVFYKSKDGTKVPMFIVHKKGLKLNGENPAYLYGYGGFNISLTPSFSLTRLILLENNFVVAIANLRGGGEYGEEWHKAGTKLQKQNVFDDFISAAEYLIKDGYTSSEKLAIAGGSNGGLLVGACMLQRPDLFKVALPAVGVLDMLRYHKFTIGWAWATDYGTSEDDKEMFDYLYNYSPVHNVKKGTCYPATLITTGDHDDRVVPAHSFKFAAELQAKHTCDNPVLIRIETKAGHGSGKPTSKIIDEYADVWSFVMYNLGVEPEY